MFRTPKDASGKTGAAQPPDEVVYHVTEVSNPTSPEQSSEPKRTLDMLNRALAEDVATEYIAHLENEIGVSINQSALNQVIGGETGDAN